MATNKNAIIRYQVLDKCFRNPGRKYFIEDLIEECNVALLDIEPNSSGVKRRQIYDDIKFMKDSRGYEAPIESYKDGRKAFYRYDDTSFSINNQPLNEQEAQQLKESILTLSRFKGMPQFEWVEELKARLEQSFNLTTEKNVLSFDDNPFLTGRENIGTLFNAIVNKQTLSIEYQSFKADKACCYIVHPYHLKQYNNRWFLFGLNDESQSIINLALDRIKNITESKTPFEPNKEIDFEEYFEDIIGVTVPDNAKLEKIQLKIDKALWPYIKTKPLHGSQRFKEENSDGVLIELELIINYEIESLLLSFGEKVRIVKPDSLRQQIANRLEEALKQYK